MTNQEAIILLERTRPKDNNAISLMLNEALTMAIKALEQEPCEKDWRFYYDHGYAQAKRDLSCEDAISRQAVLEDLYKRDYTKFTHRDFVALVQYQDTVQQEPKTGHWISHYDEDEKVGWYECDRCHTERAFNTKFCPDCGAKMVEPQDKDIIWYDKRNYSEIVVKPQEERDK